MKTLPLISRPGSGLKRTLVVIAVALLLAAGLLLTSVLLPPLAAPAHALNAPSVAAPQAPGSNGVNGTLASFAALFPEIVTVNLPIIVH
jgi:hypothetical protein